MFAFTLILLLALVSARPFAPGMSPKIIGGDPRTWSPVCRDVPHEIQPLCHELVTEFRICKNIESN